MCDISEEEWRERLRWLEASEPVPARPLDAETPFDPVPMGRTPRPIKAESG